MPQDLESLASHLNGIQRIVPLLEAVRSVSEIAYRRSTQRSSPLQAYAESVRSAFEQLLASLDVAQREEVQHLFSPRGPAGLLVISSERGLCGGFNDRIVASANELLRSEEMRGAGVLVLGARGKSRAEEAGLPIAYARPLPSLTLPTYHDVEAIALDLLDMLDQGTFGRMVVLHAAPLRGFHYELRQHSLYPPDVPPGTSRYRPIEVKPAADAPALVRHLLTEMVLVDLYQAVFASSVSEQLARVSSMRLAVDNARRLADTLSNEYGLARRHYITTSLLEIVAGYESAQAQQDGSVPVAP
jgi:F-type H+-transporting ATPase subunit gamma